jgi:FeS assembly protein IscX
MNANLEAYPDPTDPEAEDLLSWDDTFAIAQALSAQHVNTNLEDVSLGMIYRWTMELQFFKDDPELANEEILSAIYQEWFEEANPV